MSIGKHVNNIILYGSGWKSLSLIDVVNSVTFTVWLCGCNLRCPFCHNWRLAINDKEYCKPLDIDLLYEEINASRTLIDYLHLTGGEPLTQWRPLQYFLDYVRNNIGVKISVNTNFTLYKPLEKLLQLDLIDHLATDLKIPPSELYGLPNNAVKILWNQYLNSLSLLNKYSVELELRIPVPNNIDLNTLFHYIKIALNRLRNAKYYIVVNPLLGPPITTPRNIEWCRKYCDPPKEILYEIRDKIRSLGVDRVYVKTELKF